MNEEDTDETTRLMADVLQSSDEDRSSRDRRRRGQRENDENVDEVRI